MPPQDFIRWAMLAGLVSVEKPKTKPAGEMSAKVTCHTAPPNDNRDPLEPVAGRAGGL